MDPDLYHAIADGDFDLLQQPDLDFFQTTHVGNTALHVAVQSRTLASVELILAKCPSLLRRANLKGDTALHIAARQGLFDIVKTLVQFEKTLNEDDVEGGKAEVSELLVRIANKENDTALHQAVRYQHHDVVKMLVEADPGFECFENNAGETPLYLAAEAGLTEMVKQIIDTCATCAHGGPKGMNALHAAVLRNSSEIMELLLKKKPTILKETTERGQTPLHYAAHLGYHETVVQLLEFDSSVAYVTDEDGCTALHIASGKGNLGIVKKIIQFCPDSREQVDNIGRNFVHFAVRHGQKNIINYLMKSEKMIESLLNKEDIYGNTPLHILDTTTKKKAEGIHSLRKLAINIKGNLEEETILNWHDDRMRSKKEMLNTDLVVAILIATVAFTAGLTLPGGFKGDGPHEGMATLAKKASFKVFVISNTVSLLLSTYAIFLHFNVRTLNKEHLINKYLNRATVCISSSMMAMVLTFMTASYAVLSDSDALAITVCVMCSAFIATCFWFAVTKMSEPEESVKNSSVNETSIVKDKGVEEEKVIVTGDKRPISNEATIAAIRRNISLSLDEKAA